MAQGEGGGRPTKYRAHFVKQAKQLCKLGATEYELAQFFEISVETLRVWKLEHEKFSAAIKLGKAPPNRRTEMSLYHRANGYTYLSEEIFLVDHVEERPSPTEEDPKAITVIRTKTVLRVPVVKHMPPSDTALIFFLKNRMKERWRDFKATELTTPLGRPLALTYTPAGQELLQDYYAKLAQSAVAVAADPAAPHDLGSDGREWEEPGGDPDPRPR